MEFSGRYVIPANVDSVWAALNDPNILRQCIPGCEELEMKDASHLGAVVTLRIGPVKAKFRANIEITDVQAPFRCVLKGEGQGGVAGFARGNAAVSLLPTGDITTLDYNAHGAIGGKLAQLGQRLIDSAAKQIADEFFGRFSKVLGAHDPKEIVEYGSPNLADRSLEHPTFSVLLTRKPIAYWSWLVGAALVLSLFLISYRLLSPN